VVSIGEGYHGCHGVISLHQKLTGAKVVGLDCPAEELGVGDLIHLETPLNPTGEARSIEYYAQKAHSRGAFLLVDGTFAPPPLQDPFKHGADIVMHSGTKYFGGHSDMLCGVLAVSPTREDWWQKLFEERLHLGSVMGSMEAWLGSRSLQTLELRVLRQSQNTTAIVAWLKGLLSGIDAGLELTQAVRKTIHSISHASLQVLPEGQDWLKNQMPNGFGPVFSIYLQNEGLAKRLPSLLSLFQHATSLGGVESLIEWRRMSDPTVDTKLVRVSIGVENLEDLKEDLAQALIRLAE
jgi:cystathionine beta-lyase/cystathionine gamma-synthase